MIAWLVRQSPQEAFQRPHRRGHPPREQVQAGALVREREALRRDHLEVAGDAAAIAVVRQRERSFRGSDRAILNVRLFFNIAKTTASAIGTNRYRRRR